MYIVHDLCLIMIVPFDLVLYIEILFYLIILTKLSMQNIWSVSKKVDPRNTLCLTELVLVYMVPIRGHSSIL